MLRTLIFGLSFLASGLFLNAQVQHADFDALLKKYVDSNGKVNYKGLKKDQKLLDNYVKSLADNPPSNAPKNEQMAFWINAYNALTLQLIVNNYPLSKITNLDGGKTWDVKRYAIGGKKMSLNDIENNILRPMGDARIHFAINCAAKSCPPLVNQAFTADNLNALLDARTKNFVNNTKYNSLKNNEVKISKIFDWYGKDFGNLVGFLNKFSTKKINADAKIIFNEYDWSLNE